MEFEPDFGGRPGLRVSSVYGIKPITLGALALPFSSRDRVPAVGTHCFDQAEGCSRTPVPYLPQNCSASPPFLAGSELGRTTGRHKTPKVMTREKSGAGRTYVEPLRYRDVARESRGCRTGSPDAATRIARTTVARSAALRRQRLPRIRCSSRLLRRGLTGRDPSGEKWSARSRHARRAPPRPSRSAPSMARPFS
jgi:hypothetical protein